MSLHLRDPKSLGALLANGNRPANRAWKRAKRAAEVTANNRAARRTTKRAAYAEELRMRAEVTALVTAQAPDAIVNHGVAAA